MENNKRILYFTSHYFPNLGGITQYTSNLIHGLTEKGCSVDVATLNVYNMAEITIENDIQVYHFPSINLLDGRFPIPNLFSHRFTALKKKMLKEKPQLIIVNARFYLLSLYAVSLAKKMKVKCIVIDHGSSHLTMNTPLLTKCGEIYEHIITGMIRLKKCDFYGVSRASVNWLKHFHINAKGVLYNAVNLEAIDKILASPSRDYKEEFGLIDDSVVVAYTGRLVIEKGILPLVEAVKELRLTRKNIFLFIAGEGPLEHQIKREMDEGIYLLGQIPFDQIISLLKQSTILCLPSASEGFPTSVLEAVACNCFVAATKIGGATEIIPTSDYGILLEENDKEHIMNAICFVMEHRDEVRKVTDNSKEYMCEHFTWNRTVEQVYNMLF